MRELNSDGEKIAASLAEPSAFGTIFERHFGVIHGYLRRRLDDQLAAEPPRRAGAIEAGAPVEMPARGSSASPPISPATIAAMSSVSCGRSRR